MKKTFKLSEDFIFHAIADKDEAHLVNIHDDSQDMFLLEGVARTFFELIEQKKDFEDIVSEIELIYEVERDVLIEDLEDLIQELLQKSILIELS